MLLKMRQGRALPLACPILAIVTSLLLGLAGCQYYADFRLKQTQADMQEERAALMRAYRECLQKYEKDPPKATEYCAVYTQSLREIEIRRPQER
jgi:hypothetical protein